jgi:hypothetical protein
LASDGSGTEGWNPAPSANESSIFGILQRNERKSAVFRRYELLKDTGEL